MASACATVSRAIPLASLLVLTQTGSEGHRESAPRRESRGWQTTKCHTYFSPPRGLLRRRYQVTGIA